MASFVTLEREEYDDLIRDAAALSEALTTLDLILDDMKDRAMWVNGKACFTTMSELEELANIFRYRMPAEWHEFEKQVQEADKELTDD